MIFIYNSRRQFVLDTIIYIKCLGIKISTNLKTDYRRI